MPDDMVTGILLKLDSDQRKAISAVVAGSGFEAGSYLQVPFIVRQPCEKHGNFVIMRNFTQSIHECRQCRIVTLLPESKVEQYRLRWSTSFDHMQQPIRMSHVTDGPSEFIAIEELLVVQHHCDLITLNSRIFLSDNRSIHSRQKARDGHPWGVNFFTEPQQGNRKYAEQEKRSECRDQSHGPTSWLSLFGFFEHINQL